MNPVFPVNNKGNNRPADPVLFGENQVLGPFSNPLTDIHDLCIRKLSPEVPLATGGSAFSYFIRIVIGVSADEKMRRSDTRTDIAMMENAKPFWYFSEMELKGSSMCEDQFVINTNPTISVTGAICPSPEPALFAFFNILPKSYLPINGGAHGCT